ncbi:Uncharacterised protein [uncultured archaeon]|nr:Uncharacterised protein [uncultured archaeon]
MDTTQQKPGNLEKGIVYTTSALFLDVIAGIAFTGKPFHEAIGIELPSYLQTTEDMMIGLGMAYSILKGYYR